MTTRTRNPINTFCFLTDLVINSYQEYLSHRYLVLCGGTSMPMGFGRFVQLDSTCVRPLGLGGGTRAILLIGQVGRFVHPIRRLLRHQHVLCADMLAGAAAREGEQRLLATWVNASIARSASTRSDMTSGYSNVAVGKGTKGNFPCDASSRSCQPCCFRTSKLW